MKNSAKGVKSDSLAVRQEFQARNTMHALYPIQMGELDRDGNLVYKYAKPAPWVWPLDEFKIVLDVMKNVQTPTNYGSSLAYKIGDRRMGGFKSHDWHNVLHDLLPIAIPRTLTKGVRETVYKLSSLFRRLCAKEIWVADIPEMVEDAIEVACLMEMNLPPSFFDIQPHHIVHRQERF
jgi:hypothetical protein